VPTVTAAVSMSSLWPEILLSVVGCAVLIVGQAARHSARQAVTWITLVTLAAAFVMVCVGVGMPAGGDAATITSGLAFTSLSTFTRMMTLLLGLLITLVSWACPRDEDRGEFFAMMLFSLAGVMLVASAANLVILFLALELVSIPTYVMIALSRANPRAVESATKYFFLGALAAALTAFGFSYLYGVIGGATLDADAVGRVVDALADPAAPAHAVAVVGLLLSFLGVLFKIAAVPLHFYIADVYQGAASPVAGLLGFVPKAAGLLAIFRIISLVGWDTTGGTLFWILWIVAAVTMTVGNVLALQQTNIKRLLAYSGIAHSGYMLVGILAGPLGDGIIGDGTAAVLYYVVIYGIANLCAFAILGVLRRKGRPAETLRDVAGLLRYYPSLALLLALAMFTLMGLPPTPGFWGKLSLFGSALATANQVDLHGKWIIALVIIAVLNSAVAAAYYLRVIAAVLLYETDEPAEPSERQAPLMGGLLCGFLLLAFMFYPNRLMTMGRGATTALHEAPQAVVAPAPPTVEAAAAVLAQPEPR